MIMEYKIIIDQQIVDDYNEHYFKLHPRARKKAIERPVLISLNQILILKRPQIAALKAKWHEFGLWLVKRLGYEDLMLDKFELEVKVYMPSRRRSDIDNFCAGGLKLLLDPLTDSKMIVDDSYFHFTKLTASMGYDKDNSRTELTFRTIEEEITKQQ